MKRSRKVEVRNTEDGMGWLHAFAPIDQVRAAHSRIDTLARALGSEDGRSMDERRADVLMELLLGSAYNGDPKCSRHHRRKTETDWTATRGDTGDIIWAHPDGLRYVRTPEPLLPDIPHPTRPPEPKPPPHPTNPNTTTTTHPRSDENNARWSTVAQDAKVEVWKRSR